MLFTQLSQLGVQKIEKELFDGFSIKKSCYLYVHHMKGQNNNNMITNYVLIDMYTSKLS